MLIHKTPAAAQALAERAACSVRERQLLIMCNGQRSTHDILALLGAETQPILLNLERKGFLTGVSLPQRAQTASASPAAAKPTRAKNPSIAASKIYVLDVLQLQQNDCAKKIAQSLREATVHADILDSIVTALNAILERSGESYGERVSQRVFEVIPDGLLEEFINTALRLDAPLFNRLAQSYRVWIPQSASAAPAA